MGILRAYNAITTEYETTRLQATARTCNIQTNLAAQRATHHVICSGRDVFGSIIRADVSLLFSSCCYQSHVLNSTDGGGQQGCNWMQKHHLNLFEHYIICDNSLKLIMRCRKKLAKIIADEWILLHLLLIVSKNILKGVMTWIFF